MKQQPLRIAKTASTPAGYKLVTESEYRRTVTLALRTEQLLDQQQKFDMQESEAFRKMYAAAEIVAAVALVNGEAALIANVARLQRRIFVQGWDELEAIRRTTQPGHPVDAETAALIGEMRDAMIAAGDQINPDGGKAIRDMISRHGSALGQSLQQGVESARRRERELSPETQFLLRIIGQIRSSGARAWRTIAQDVLAQLETLQEDKRSEDKDIAADIYRLLDAQADKGQAYLKTIWNRYNDRAGSLSLSDPINSS